MARVNRQWVLRQRPKGLIQPGDLELVESPVPELKDSEVLVRTVYLSLDPYQWGRRRRGVRLRWRDGAVRGRALHGRLRWGGLCWRGCPRAGG